MYFAGRDLQMVKEDEALTPASIRHTVLSVPGLCCCTCIEHVERCLSALQGVSGYQIDPLTRCIGVEYDSARCGLIKLIAAIKRAGYQVQDALAQ